MQLKGHTFKNIPVSYIDVTASGVTNTLSFALKNDGTVWSWGGTNSADYGQKGDNATVGRSSPVSVVGNHSFTAVAAGAYSGYGLKSDGSVWSWGYNSLGNLGTNSNVNRSSPVSVVGNHSFIQISACGLEGTFYGFAISLKSDGTAWTWGGAATPTVVAGQIGDNNNVSRSSPVSVVGNHSFIGVVSGGVFNSALKADGSVWCWGDNATYGNLGDNSVTPKSSPVSVVGAHSFTKLCCGAYNSAGLKADGTVWCWGDNYTGCCGDNSPLGGTLYNRSSPVSVVGNHSFIDITNGITQFFGKKSNGELWGWGQGSSSQIGDGNTSNRNSPVKVLGPVFEKVGSRSGNNNIFHIDAYGTIWGNGDDSYGGLAQNTQASVPQSSPVAIIGVPYRGTGPFFLSVKNLGNTGDPDIIKII